MFAVIPERIKPEQIRNEELREEINRFRHIRGSDKIRYFRVLVLTDESEDCLGENEAALLEVMVLDDKPCSAYGISDLSFNRPEAVWKYADSLEEAIGKYWSWEI